MPAKKSPFMDAFKFGWSLGEGDWHTDMDNNLIYFSALLSLTVKSKTLSAPPTAADGDAYIVGDSPRGDWSNKTGQIALFIDKSWHYLVPKTGLSAKIEDEEFQSFMFNGKNWVDDGKASAKKTGAVRLATDEEAKKGQGDGVITARQLSLLGLVS